VDPAGPPGHLDRWAAALSGVWLERSIELDNVRLTVRDWPGHGRPIIHVADPLRESSLLEQFGAFLPPRYRLVSVSPRPDQPYQVLVADLHGLFAQFGFQDVGVVAEGLSCASARLLAAWYPELVHALVLLDEQLPEGDALLARSLRDCPPLRHPLACPVVELASTGTAVLNELQTLLG
jgi:pimeloyl-ACP methyl ester carboxylesterase